MQPTVKARERFSRFVLPEDAHRVIRELRKRHSIQSEEVWEKLRVAIERGNLSDPETYLERILRFHTTGETVHVEVVSEATQAEIDRTWWSRQTAWNGTTDCHLWLGPTNRDGYGRITIDGSNTSAHRLAWETLVGRIASGMHIHHVCRNRRCVNPAHLVPVPMAAHNRLHSLEDSVTAAEASGELHELMARA